MWCSCGRHPGCVLSQRSGERTWFRLLVHECHRNASARQLASNAAIRIQMGRFTKYIEIISIVATKFRKHGLPCWYQHQLRLASRDLVGSRE